MENLHKVQGQFDVRAVFLYSEIDAKIYMIQHQGFDDGSGHVCRLKTFLYVRNKSLSC